MHNTCMDPHHRLKLAREKAGYETAVDAAEEMDINIQTYLAHENGSRGFARVVGRYAKKYKVSADWLLMGIGRPPSGADPLDGLTPEQREEVLRYADFIRSKGDGT